jgi:UrcA family protein
VLAPAALAEKPVHRSFMVEYADLNLLQHAGVKVLLSRISVASKKVCGPRPTSVRFARPDHYLACREQAEVAAVRSIGVPSVTLAYEGSMTGSPVQTASR